MTNVPRKTTDERLASLKQRQERLHAQMAALESRKRTEERRRETRRAFVVGAAALARAEADPAFREALRHALAASITQPADKAIVADLFGMEGAPSQVAGAESPTTETV